MPLPWHFKEDFHSLGYGCRRHLRADFGHLGNLACVLPLITTNCAVLGVSLTVVTKEFSFVEGEAAALLNLGESVVYAVGIALGFALALVIFAGIREHIDLMEPPKGMKGTPIALITAGILAMAFMGFTGIV